jgi:hypothetical protein
MLSVLILGITCVSAQQVQHVNRFANTHHPEIGYWFISPNLLEHEAYMQHLDSIAAKCPYTLVFLTARDGANFYEYKTWQPVFKKLVAEAHRKGLQVGLQLWGNYRVVPLEHALRLTVEHELTLDATGSASLTATAKYIRFPDRLLKSDLLKVYAFRKTGDGFYDPATLRDITASCSSSTPDIKTVQVQIKAGIAMAGYTVCVMTQEYCSQSSNYGNDEVRRFTEAMDVYKDVPFDGFALDEYGNKFVSRIADMPKDDIEFRGRWYAPAMERAFREKTGKDLLMTMFQGRYAATGKPETRMRAINVYMDFMREGANRIEKAIYDYSRKTWGTQIFNGIHNTYHNSLINDEIWANGIGWWEAPRAYGQTDEKTPTSTQMGIAIAHRMNAMYNQYYDAVLPPVIAKSLHDLRYGIRTHYHAMNDKRPLRFDLEMPEAIDSINIVENCARLLNRFNPSLPDIKVLVVFGMEALCNWYPNTADRGVYDINDKIQAEERAHAVWNAGYLDALVPSTLIANGTLRLNEAGKPVMNGHVFDAVIYLNPQYAKEKELQFLETYQQKGGKLMLQGRADHDFNGNDIENRFAKILTKTTVTDFNIARLPELGVQPNALADGCRNRDGSVTFTNLPSIRTNRDASFSVNLAGRSYEGKYRGLAVIKADKSGVEKFAAAGCTEVRCDGKIILSFPEPVSVYGERVNGKMQLTIGDGGKHINPLINQL